MKAAASQGKPHLFSLLRFNKTVHIICRTKKSNYNLQKLIRQNQENLMLFGPKLKAKKGQTVKKESKMVKAEDGFVTTNDYICEQSDWDPFVVDTSIIKDTIHSEKCDTENSQCDADISEITHTNIHILKPGSKSKSAGKCESNELKSHDTDFSFIDNLLNISLCPNQSSTDNELNAFRSHVERLSLHGLPSVSAILNKTQTESSRFFLERWKLQMVTKLGEDGFKRYKEEILNNGVNLHANIQQFLMGEQNIEIQPSVKGYWQSLEGVLSNVEDVLACEESVTHEDLIYKGKFDCVAVYRNHLCVIDWKTSQKPKPLLSNTFDNPLQVAAYLGAINSSVPLQFGPVTNAAIVVAYSSGEPAHVHLMEQKVCQQQWSRWLQRLHHYWKMLFVERQNVMEVQD